jgi:zinc-dependent metalloproteinase lipoprotein
MRKLLAVIGFLTLLIGCGGDDATDVKVIVEQPSGGNSGNTDAHSVSYVWDSSVTSQVIRLSASASWSVKSDDHCKNWCYPVKSSGTSDKIVLWVSPNITDKARSGKVTVQLGGKKQEIFVSQPAFTGNLDTYDYHLPVVFHVMYHNKSDKKQNPDKSHFTKILDAVNKLYAANNMHIVFEMAKYNDEGEELEEPGIIRKKVDFKEYDPHEFLKDEDYAEDVQNLKKFINIFVFCFAQSSDKSTTLGLTTLPILPTAYPDPKDLLNETDAANDYAYLTTPFGVCINNEFIDVWQDEGTIKATYIVSTVAHELGHYVGLLHTFSENECEEDDGCDDTHISDYENYLAYIQKYQNDEIAKGRDPNSFNIKELGTRTDCKTGEEFIADNILDYAYTIGDVFTADQKKRTRHVLKYGALTPGPKLIDYNTTGIVTKSTNKSSQRAAASRPGMVQTDPCPKVPVNRLPQIGLK